MEDQLELNGLEAPQPDPVTSETPDPNTGDPSADDSGSSDQPPVDETEEQRQAREASEAARALNARKQQNRDNAARRLQEDRDAWRQLAQNLAQGNRQPQQPQQPQQPEAPREPTMDFDPNTGKPFTSYETFLERRAAWIGQQTAERIITERLQQAVQQSNQQRQQWEAAEIDRAHSQRNREFARQVADFDDVTNQDIPIPGHAAEAIKRAQNGPAIIYALGKNPELVQELGQRSPVEQVMMIGQLSSWIAANSQQKQVSQSAPAGRGVSGRPAPSDTAPEDFEAYEAWANKRFGKR